MSDPIELPLANKVDAVLVDVFGGVHRVRKVELKGHYYEVIPHGTMATYDDDKLTLLVIACHRYGVRAEIDNHGMRGLKIMLHNRTVRAGRMFDRHPTLEYVLEANRG